MLLLATTISIQAFNSTGGLTVRPFDNKHDHHSSDRSLAASAALSAAAPATLPRINWTVTVDSQENAVPGYTAAAAIDGSPATFWHTRWIGTQDPLPHTLTIDMHDTFTISALKYLPRPASSGRNGNIGRYEVHVSADGTTWNTPVASGQFADDSAAKVVSFPTRSARYVRLTALTEAGRRGPWTNAAEIDLLGYTDPVLPRAGWTVTADSQETAVAGYAATSAIDGNPASFWHTRWIGTTDPLPNTLTIDMHETVTVAGIAYLPRPAATGRNGNIDADVDGVGSAVARTVRSPPRRLDPGATACSVSPSTHSGRTLRNVRHRPGPPTTTSRPIRDPRVHRRRNLGWPGADWHLYRHLH